MSLYDYNPTAIQTRLDKLSLAELVILCYDHFPEVYQLFKANKEMTLPQKIALLHQHCAKTQNWAKLLTYLNVNPMLYQQVNSIQKRDFVNLLITCDTMSRRDRRDIVVEDLPIEISSVITRDEATKFDVRNIVDACLKYPHGLRELINVIRYYENSSFAMQQIDEFLR